MTTVQTQTTQMPGILSIVNRILNECNVESWPSLASMNWQGNLVLEAVNDAVIEIHRTKPEVVFAALQPGTVDSPLSAQFSKGHPLTRPCDAAVGLLMALDRLHAKGSAWFVDFRGDEIPW